MKKTFLSHYKRTLMSSIFLTSLIGVTLIVSAAYISSIEDKANEIFENIKQNANSLDNDTDKYLYYTLVKSELQSLGSVIDRVDQKLTPIIATTKPSEITDTSNIFSGFGNDTTNGSNTVSSSVDDDAETAAFLNALEGLVDDSNTTSSTSSNSNSTTPSNDIESFMSELENMINAQSPVLSTAANPPTATTDIESFMSELENILNN